MRSILFLLVTCAIFINVVLYFQLINKKIWRNNENLRIYGYTKSSHPRDG